MGNVEKGFVADASSALKARGAKREKHLLPGIRLSYKHSLMSAAKAQ